MAPLIQIDAKRPRTTGPAVLRTGFRPFFLCAAVWIVVALAIWALALVGLLPARPPTWHGHEMLSGFTLAVVIGFLLTAVRNWTGRETARAGSLAALVGVWASARVAALAGASRLEGALDLLLLAGTVVAIGLPIVATRNLRNAPFVLVLASWAALDVVFHSAPAWASWALARELDLVTLLMVVISGRVVPGFTANALPDAGVERSPRLDRLAVACAVALLFAWSFPPPVRGAVGILAGSLVLARARGWAADSTWRMPILWILHVGHALLGVGLVVRGLAAWLPAIPSTLGTHLLTVGAIGTLTLGMMTRVSLGHTGRPLRAPRLAVLGYSLAIAATVVRAAAALRPEPLLLALSASLLALAFLLFLVAYAPILVSSRADGAPE